MTAALAEMLDAYQRATVIWDGEAIRRVEPRFHRLPIIDDRPRDVCGRRRSKATLPGFRRGIEPANKGRTYPADPPTDEEVRDLMNACPTHTLIGSRNRALIALLRGSGLRVSEALSLYPDDLDFEHCTVLVRKGKGGKRRRSGINRGALEEVGVWMLVRSFAGFTHDEPVFCVVEGPTRGGRLGTPYLRTWLKRTAEQVGILRRVHPHGFRHALAVDMARRRVPLPLISRQLGHSNVATTATYLAGIADVEVFEVVADLDWGKA